MTKIAALFIDFDNLFHALRDDEPALANRFGLRPDSWLDALTRHGGGDEEGPARRLVIRRCYASPHLVQSSRNNLVRAGLELIDMQPLTSGGKNAADIQMVLDIMDTMTRYPHIEEFLILSGDSDFVPLLHRLRRDMKWTTVFAPANIAAAYKNCADFTISAEFFRAALGYNSQGDGSASRTPPRQATPVPVQLEMGNGVNEESGKPSVSPASGAPKPISPEVTEQARKLAHSLSQQWLGRVPFAALASSIKENMPSFVGTNWAGHGNFVKLLAAFGLKGFHTDASVPTNHVLVEADFALDLSDWGEAGQGEMAKFVLDIIRNAGKKLPLRRPDTYSFVFDQLAAYYNGDPQDFADAIGAVVAAATEKKIELLPNDVRFIGNGISLQGYKLDRGATPRLLAQLWRLNVFDLCDQPEWLEDEEDAQFLVDWFHANGEDLADAAEEFRRLVSEGGTIEAEPVQLSDVK